MNPDHLLKLVVPSFTHSSESERPATWHFNSIFDPEFTVEMKVCYQCQVQMCCKYILWVLCAYGCECCGLGWWRVERNSTVRSVWDSYSHNLSSLSRIESWLGSHKKILKNIKTLSIKLLNVCQLCVSFSPQLANTSQSL